MGVEEKERGESGREGRDEEEIGESLCGKAEDESSQCECEAVKEKEEGGPGTDKADRQEETHGRADTRHKQVQIHVSRPGSGGRVDALQSPGREPARDHADQGTQDPAGDSTREFQHTPSAVPAQAKKGKQEGEQNGTPKPGAPVSRPGQDEIGGDIGVDRVLLRGGVLPVGGQELAHYSQSVVAVMLQAPPIEIIEVVERCMVMLGASNKGEVDAIQAPSHEDGEIGGVGHPAVDGDVGRAAHGPVQTVRHLVDHPGIPVGCLEHETTPGGAPGLEIHDHADALRGFVEA